MTKTLLKKYGDDSVKNDTLPKFNRTFEKCLEIQIGDTIDNLRKYNKKLQQT